jgi:hypothetical protein
MEPISLILTALVAGATAAGKDVAGKAVKDSYEGLKALIKKKFEGDALAQGMIEAKPEEIKQVEGLLKTKIAAVGIDKDEEILKAAEAIMKRENPEAFQGVQYNTTSNVQGDVIGSSGTNSGTINVGNITR